MRAVPDQIRQWVGGRYVTLGTDGFGRSDSRARCAGTSRSTALHRRGGAQALADDTRVDQATVSRAIKALGVDPAKPVPWKV